MSRSIHLFQVHSCLHETDGARPLEECFDLSVLRLPGVDVDVTFVVDEYKSHLRLSLTATLAERTVVKFPVEACKRYKLQKVDASSYQRIVGHQLAPDDTCHLAVLKFDLRHVCAEGLFVEGCASCLEPLQQYLTCKEIIAFSVNDHDAYQHSQDMLLSFQKEVSGGHLSHWAKVFAKIPCLPDRPPQHNVSAKLAFFDWNDYALTLGIGMEYERQLCEAEKKTYKCNVRIVEIPGNKNKFQAIISGPSNMKLSPGEKATLIFVEDLKQNRGSLEGDERPEKA